jgi:hypothetical protein
MDEEKRGPGDGGTSRGPRRGATTERGNDAAPRALRTPSFDVGQIVRAGLTLIPLHRWNAKDKKGRDRGKTPRDANWQARDDYDNERTLADAIAAGINLGVRLPATVVVLDVDPRNFPEGRDSLAELVAAAELDLSACPLTITGSGGKHYWFRKPADVQLLDTLEDYQGVEFKSLGRQVVAAGSVHPNGTRYEWHDLSPDLGEMPELPESLIRLARRPVRAHGEATGAGELTPEMLAESLEWLEPEDFRHYNERWLPLMMACHHATAGEGRSEFIEWSTRDPDYADDAWTIGYKWDRLHLHPTAGRKGRPVTIKYLHKVVQEAGGQVARAEPEDDFEAWENPEDVGRGVDDAALRTEPRAVGLDAVLDEMNERHAVVMEGGKFRIFTEKMDPVLKRPFFQRSTKEDFENLYCNSLIEKNDKLMSRSAFWVRHPRRRQYDGVIFDPAGEHEGWLNLWKGWAVKPEPGDWSLLQDLIRDVLVDGNQEHYEWVLDWMAFMFQHPEQVAEVAVAFRGDKGTGKGTLGRALATIAGTHGLHISSPEHLVGRFNSHLQNCVCLFADEAFWAGDKPGESKLKQLVTEPTLTYEGKGRDAVTGRNHTHIVLASNSDWVVPAGMDGERRFAVFEVNNGRKGDHAFFARLNRQLDEGGRAAMLHDLLARDLGGHHPRENIPQTRALSEQKQLSLSPEESWWDELLEAGQLPTFMAEMPWDEQEVEADVDELYRDYVAHAQGLRQRPRTKAGLAMRIKRRAGIERRQVTVGGRVIWRWVLPRLDEAREIWAKAKG